MDAIEKLDLDNKVLDCFSEEFSLSEESTFWPRKEPHHSFIYRIYKGDPDYEIYDPEKIVNNWIVKLETEYYLVSEYLSGGFRVFLSEKQILLNHIKEHGSDLDKKLATSL